MNLKKIMSSSFYSAGNQCVVKCLPVGGAKVTQITAESQMQRHLLAEGCILYIGPKVQYLTLPEYLDHQKEFATWQYKYYTTTFFSTCNFFTSPDNINPLLIFVMVTSKEQKFQKNSSILFSRQQQKNAYYLH